MFNSRHEVSCRHQRKVFRALIFELFEDIRKFLRSYRFAAFGSREFVVLAKHATKGTTCKEDCATAVFKRDTRLFKGVKVVFCDFERRDTTRAYAVKPIRAAFSRTKCAIFFVVDKNGHEFTQNNFICVYYSTNAGILQAETSKREEKRKNI
jgi:hypothetical protein